jgi:hypothetical protein
MYRKGVLDSTQFITVLHIYLILPILNKMNCHPKEISRFCTYKRQDGNLQIQQFRLLLNFPHLDGITHIEDVHTLGKEFKLVYAHMEIGEIHANILMFTRQLARWTMPK